ncbi:MAG: nucleoside hydrolase [Chthoniobacter sp.]
MLLPTFFRRYLVLAMASFTLLAVAAISTAEPPGTARVKIVFDTDMETDCDDAGALAVLHALADRGECEILATVVSVRDPHSAATVDAINAYYGRPHLPLGMVKGAGVLERSSYVSHIAGDFPNRVKSDDDVPDATLVYRDVLEKQPDHSVTVVTVGYLTNLKNLLHLPAADGHPSGLDLIKSKVTQWVCMGGNFIGSPPKDDLKLGNVNFQRDPISARDAIPNWPSRIVFVGREIGSVPSGLTAGECLAKTPAENPVRMAYFHYFGAQKSRHVADLVTTLYAVRGLRDYWDSGSPGAMDLHPDMTFEWQPGNDKSQSYLLKKLREGKPNDRYIESVLNELLVQPPRH